MTRTTLTTMLGACSIVALLGGAQAQQADAEKFFTGRSVDFLIGSAPGGGYGIYGAVLGRHIGKHLPGKPNVVSRNLDGAGSITAFAVASTIGIRNCRSQPRKFIR